jgi:hypothetical protein
MRAYSFGIVAAGVLALSASGCELQPRRGRAGMFDVRETLVSNACGLQAVPVQPVVRYRAELGIDGARATWRLPASGTEAVGTYTEATGAFRFTAESFVTLREADRFNQRAACVVRQLDVIDGVLTGTLPSLEDAGNAMDAAEGGVASDAGTMPAAFTGTETILIGPIEGADCRDAIGASDGQFNMLPCEVRFNLRGELEATP